mmetsp:Transcript_3298/g.12672  ORF Transcript_3298/g.12672 Transcript_3298/m.12672 type:complete len:490 (-) Transcript_3298:3254-4723(-)
MSESPPLSRRKRETTDARKPEEGPENQPHNHKMDDAAAFACSWCAMLLVRSVVLLRAKRLRFGQWIRGSSSGACGGAAMAACCAVLLVPTSRVGFAVATGLSAAFQWASLPHQLDNSGFFALLTNVQLLAARGDARLVASGVRRVFVIMYAAAAFAKLNDGFVDERRGATTVFVVHSLEAWVPSWLKRRIVLGRNTKNNTATSSSADAAVLKWLGRTAAVVLATEVAIPVTLVAVPTVGARLAWAFHVVLCATAFDFSVTAVATLPLFYLSMSRGDYAAAVAWCFGSVATRLLVVFAFLAMVFPVGRARTAATKSAVATSPWGGSSTQAAAAVLVVALYPGAWARHRSPVPLLSWNVPSAALRLGDDDDDASTAADAGRATTFCVTKVRPTNLRASSMMTTIEEKAKTRSHSLSVSGTIAKMSARSGTYMMRKWRPKDRAMASSKYGLTQGRCTRSETSSESALSELNISIATRTESERVEALTLPLPK